MRRASLLLMVAVMVLALAASAQAKGEFGEGKVTETVAIAGPGLPGSVGLDRAATTAYLDTSNLFNPTSRMPIRPGAVDLGPRFDLLLTMSCAGPSGSQTVSIRQDLYPYASFKGQPQMWTYTPAGQYGCDPQRGVLADGWNATRRGLFDTLVAAGLPPTAPVQAPVPGPVQSPAAPPDRLWPVFWTLAALMLLLLVALATRRPRRRARVLS